MPFPDFEAARDEAVEFVQAIWDAGSETSSLLLVHDAVVQDRPTAPDATQPTAPQAWGFVSIQHPPGSTRQTAFAPKGARRYESEPVLTVQVFTVPEDGLQLALKIAKILVEGLEGGRTANGLTFHQVGPQEVGSSGSWYQLNVLANLRYARVR